MEAFDFNKSLQRLEEIIKLLENGNCSLEDAIKLYEEGKALREKCTAVLEQAKQRIEGLE